MEERRREIILRYLIDAYRKLESSCQQPTEKSREVWEEIAQAIADIQLFGTVQQNVLVRKIFPPNKHIMEVEVDDILDELRKELRSELNLHSISEGRVLVRWTPQ